MERISIFNYEAFYLDFLEGNLNEEDTALFLAFLEENPDLKMEEESLPTFDLDEKHTLDNTTKADLKQYEDDAVINIENAEYFMISEAEGLLNKEKQLELDALSEQHETLKKDRAIYGATILSPNLDQTYTDKEELKQKGIVLWPYLSLVAAASVVGFIFIWLTLSGGSILEPKSTLSKHKKQKKSNDFIQQETVDTPEDVETIHFENQIAINYPENSSPSTVNEKKDKQTVRDQKQPIEKIDARPIQLIATIDNRVIEPLTPDTYAEESSSPKYLLGNDYSTTAFAEMENPIEPITKFIEKKTKTEVDFRREKKSEKKRGGFFLKIGKFKISHRKN